MTDEETTQMTSLNQTGAMRSRAARTRKVLVEMFPLCFAEAARKAMGADLATAIREHDAELGDDYADNIEITYRALPIKGDT